MSSAQPAHPYMSVSPQGVFPIMCVQRDRHGGNQRPPEIPLGPLALSNNHIWGLGWVPFPTVIATSIMQHNPMLSPRPQSSEHVQGSPSKKRRLLLWLPTSLKGLAGVGSTCVFTSYVAFNTLWSTSGSLSFITCDMKPGYRPLQSCHRGKECPHR